ncbi:hypothetical protein QR680_000456 [Steinernema hermaphroditum]|uniref:BRCT domain-containing protein n=1 Tax=Steinernema hermaphroditum TaxID=289476 RepID=A0AA39GUN8_9BILA|nr:hypothetical protein QR680_000456 [Steinernema hermaphroditum]
MMIRGLVVLEAVHLSKRRLKKEIANRGGIVLETFMAADRDMEMYLIANLHCRTYKYLTALALSVECVSYTWLEACFKKDMVVNHRPYMLHAGVNPLTNEIVRWHPNTDVLRGRTVVLAGDSEASPSPFFSPKRFVEMWKPLLEVLGARVQRELPPITRKRSRSRSSDIIDVVITDGTSEASIMAAKKRNIPITTSDWIISVLITGRYLEFDLHPSFRFREKSRPN